MTRSLTPLGYRGGGVESIFILPTNKDLRVYWNHPMYIVKMFEIVFSFNVKDTNIFPCLQNIRLSCNIKQLTWWFSLLKVMKIPTQKGEHS